MPFPGSTNWSQNVYGARELIGRLAIMLEDPGMKKFPVKYYEDTMNIAQNDVCVDTLALTGVKDGIYTVGSQRSYDIRTDWEIYDLLVIRHVAVGGRLCERLENGFDDMDFETNPETTYPEGYHLAHETLYFENIPADAQEVVIRYIKRPAALVANDATSVFALPPEYLQAVFLRAKMHLLPAGSLENIRAEALYAAQMERLIYLRSLS